MTVPRIGHGRAHAKLILFGEHIVLHGGGAVALPWPELGVRAEAEARPGPLSIDSALLREKRRERDGRDAVAAAAPRAAAEAVLTHLGMPVADLEIRIESDIPAGRGLGSSAATAGAIVEAVADLHGVALEPGERFALVQLAERVAHGSPSGLDAHATQAAAPLWFHHGEATALPVADGLPLVIADTGVAGSTLIAVNGVRSLLETQPATTRARIERLSAISAASRESLRTGDLASLGAGMSETQELLAGIGVSSPEIETLVRAALRADALGAKLSGGGLGGCIVAVAASADEAAALEAALLRAGAVRSWTLMTEAAAPAAGTIETPGRRRDR